MLTVYLAFGLCAATLVLAIRSFVLSYMPGTALANWCAGNYAQVDDWFDGIDACDGEAD